MSTIVSKSDNVHKDKNLILAAQENSADFETLYYKYQDKIFNYFFFRTGHDRETAEEMTQETFLKAFKSLASFKIQGYSYFSYLSKIAHNLLVNYYRAPHPILVETIEDTRIVTNSRIEEKLDAETLWRDIAQNFTSAERKAMLLFYYKNIAIKDIAEKMHRSQNAIKLLLSHARKRLRSQHLRYFEKI